MTTKNNLAYRLNERLMATSARFAADNPGQVDISVLLGAANIFFSSLLANAPTKAIALETLTCCQETQERLIKATPPSFFGQGLNQNPDYN